MTCQTPITIKNPQVRLKQEDLYIHVPCGRCVNCLKRRALGWVHRLKQEDLHATTSTFMTYTYNDQEVPISKNGYLTLDRTHHRLFMKRLRKQLVKEGYTEKLKYYMVGEYGGQTERPHYHAILFNLPQFYIDNEHKIEKIWKKGRVQADQVTDASIAYVCGYVNKQTFFRSLGHQDDREKEFSFMSQGLGKDI